MATNQRTRQLINRATSYKGSHTYLWCLQTQEPVCTEPLLCLSERQILPKPYPLEAHILTTHRLLSTRHQVPAWAKATKARRDGEL